MKTFKQFLDEIPAYCSTPGLTSQSLKDRCDDAKEAEREREAEKKKKETEKKPIAKIGAKVGAKGLSQRNEFDPTKEGRDYKDEYKKFQSSPERIKYRSELVKFNRDKGTYGNGDKKDASHKGGKIVGFEAQSKNRGRAEASRIKKAK